MAQVKKSGNVVDLPVMVVQDLYSASAAIVPGDEL